MAHLTINNQSPMATLVSILVTFVYGFFFVTNKIFVSIKDFGESALKAIIVSFIAFVATKVWEYFYKKYFKKTDIKGEQF